MIISCCYGFPCNTVLKKSFKNLQVEHVKPKLHFHIVMLNVDKVKLACRWQKYDTIFYAPSLHG